MDRRDETRTRETDFSAMWSSDGVTRSLAPSGAGLPADLPFLFAAGQQFGGYRIIRPIGKGGMGQVYEAEEIESGRRIALKLLSRGLGDDEERERFLREGRLAASLSHPHCVYVFGTSEVQGFPVIAMELVPEGTLKDLVVPGSPMSGATAVDAILQVIAGLDAAAAIGILHRDVKPSNCFVHREGRVLVGDFGLSVAAGGHGSSAGTILGTPGFASPEQLRGEPLDVRSDIYSVGATLFYLLAGRTPFDERNTTDLLTKVASEPAPSLSVLRPELPRRLALAVARCLAKHAKDRYANYAELTAALEPFASTRSAPAPIVRRAAAGWIDVALTTLTAVPLIRLLDLQPFSPSHLGDIALDGLWTVAAMTVYFGVLEGQWGLTVGKALFGLRAVNAQQVTPGIPHAVRRALAFALPWEAITLILRWAILHQQPQFPLRTLTSIVSLVCVAALFATARRSNGWQGLHDRLTATSVVKRRVRVEARQRVDRSPVVEAATFTSQAHVGPYLVPEGTPAAVAARTSIDGFDERLHRRVWIDLLPPGTPPLDAARRDLDRPARARWLGGRRNGADSWDAFEAAEGLPIEQAAAVAQPWARVRHWLGDLGREIAAGLSDGSLPPLASGSMWVGQDDRARVLEWTRPEAHLARVRSEGAAPDLPSAQRQLYAVIVGALLGQRPEKAADLPPATPLPLPVRTLLLGLREAKFASAQAMLDAVMAALASPAMLPRAQRAVQIGVHALLPTAITAISIGVVLGSVRQTGMVPALDTLTTVRVWTIGATIFTGTFVINMIASALGAAITGSGFTFRPVGAALVNRRGERASRIRALWRTAVVWAPICAALIASAFVSNSSGLGPLAVETVFLAGFGAAAGWAIARPSRGVQDRLAGTWIVPR